MQTKTQAMEKMKKSKFRSRFRLSQADCDVISDIKRNNHLKFYR